MPEMSRKCGMAEWTLRKTPIWGNNYQGMEINFEFPTQEQFEELDGDVRLASISYKYDGNCNCDFTSF